MPSTLAGGLAIDPLASAYDSLTSVETNLRSQLENTRAWAFQQALDITALHANLLKYHHGTTPGEAIYEWHQFVIELNDFGDLSKNLPFGEYIERYCKLTQKFSILSNRVLQRLRSGSLLWAPDMSPSILLSKPENLPTHLLRAQIKSSTARCAFVPEVGILSANRKYIPPHELVKRGGTYQQNLRRHCCGWYGKGPTDWISTSDNPTWIVAQADNYKWHKTHDVAVIDVQKLVRLRVPFARSSDLVIEAGLEQWRAHHYRMESMPLNVVKYATDSHWLVFSWLPAEAIIWFTLDEFEALYEAVEKRQGLRMNVETQQILDEATRSKTEAASDPTDDLAGALGSIKLGGSSTSGRMTDNLTSEFARNNLHSTKAEGKWSLKASAGACTPGPLLSAQQTAMTSSKTTSPLNSARQDTQSPRTSITTGRDLSNLSRLNIPNFREPTTVDPGKSNLYHYPAPVLFDTEKPNSFGSNRLSSLDAKQPSPFGLPKLDSLDSTRPRSSFTAGFTEPKPPKIASDAARDYSKLSSIDFATPSYHAFMNPGSPGAAAAAEAWAQPVGPAVARAATAGGLRIPRPEQISWGKAEAKTATAPRRSAAVDPRERGGAGPVWQVGSAAVPPSAKPTNDTMAGLADHLSDLMVAQGPLKEPPSTPRGRVRGAGERAAAKTTAATTTYIGFADDDDDYDDDGTVAAPTPTSSVLSP